MTHPQESLFNQIQQLHMLLMRSLQQNAHTGQHDPNRGQGRVLALLALKPEISQKELTYLLGISRQAMAELLAKLEKSGFITRAASPEDPRAKIVTLTEAGAEEATKRQQPQGDDESVFACLTDEEQDTLRQLLDKLIHRCEENFPDIDFDAQRQRMRQFHAQFDEHHRAWQSMPEGGDERWQEFQARMQNATPEERERLERHWEYFRGIRDPRK